MIVQPWGGVLVPPQGLLITRPLSPFIELKNPTNGTSPVAQWIRICLLRQETWVQFLVREDSTCCRVAKPENCNSQSIAPSHLN